MAEKSKWLIFLFVICVALGIQTWAALQWPANLDSDEAVNGLVALYASQGYFSPYFLGQGYLGSMEPTLSGLLFKIFGSGVFTLRLSSLIFFAGFLVLQGLLIRKFFGEKVALVSLLILAFPSWKIMIWIFRPLFGAAPFLLIGTAVILLVHSGGWKKSFSLGRNLAIGFLIGLGLWVQPLIVYYFFTVAFVYVLSTPEWKILFNKIIRSAENPAGVISVKVLPFVTFISGIVILISLFIIGNKYLAIKILTLLFPLSIGCAVVIWLFRLSVRRRVLMIGSTALAAGFVVGNLPQWGSWIFLGIRPALGSVSSGVEGFLARLELFFGHLLPALWGVPPLAKIPSYILQKHTAFGDLSIFQMALWSLIIILICTALFFYFRTERKTLRSIISLAPLSDNERKTAIIIVLFVLPLIVVLFAGNAGDMMNVRYLLPCWHVWSVILALFIVNGLKKSKILGISIIAVWVIVVGCGNLYEIGKYWNNDAERWYSKERIAGIEQVLLQNNVRGGYTDWWNAKALSFLTEERLIFVQYNGTTKSDFYSDEVAGMSRQAIVFCPRNQLPDTLSLDGLLQVLREGIGYGPARPRLLLEFKKKSLVAREKILDWDIWILENKEANSVGTL